MWVLVRPNWWWLWVSIFRGYIFFQEEQFCCHVRKRYFWGGVNCILPCMTSIYEYFNGPAKQKSIHRFFFKLRLLYHVLLHAEGISKSGLVPVFPIKSTKELSLSYWDPTSWGRPDDHTLMTQVFSLPLLTQWIWDSIYPHLATWTANHLVLVWKWGPR